MSKLLFYINFILCYYVLNFSYNYSFLIRNANNFTYNFKCISDSNKYFSLKYIYKRLNYKGSKFVGKYNFDKRNNNSYFLNQYSSLKYDELLKVKIYKFKNVIISDSGSIHTKFYNLRLANGCRCNNVESKMPINIKKYKYVVVISQYWGNAVFHSLIECLTKISFYYSYILKHPIFIHIGKNKAVRDYIHYLGIDLNKTLSGYIQAEYADVIQNSKCGKAIGAQPLLYLKNELIKRNIFNKFAQNVIVLIKRLYVRSIQNHQLLKEIIKTIFSNFTLYIFTPYTTFNNTLFMFGNAKYIFAPHGAGLSNIILSHKNTTIIEFLPYSVTNLCYCSLSYALGYKYYGIYQKYNGYSFYINISYLSMYIKEYIK